MASLSEAYLTPASDDSNRIDKVENPQSYLEFPSAVRHVKEARHVLGLVGIRCGHIRQLSVQNP
jgi:hypothetical protein